MPAFQVDLIDDALSLAKQDKQHLVLNARRYNNWPILKSVQCK